jgi:hypothetical protein
VANQQLGKVEITALLCLHQRRETSVLSRIRAGARFQEYLGVVHPPRGHGAVQRGRLRSELLVRRSSLQVGPGGNQRANGLRRAEERGVMESCEPVRAPAPSNLGISTQQLLETRDLAECGSLEDVERLRLGGQLMRAVALSLVERLEDRPLRKS